MNKIVKIIIAVAVVVIAVAAILVWVFAFGGDSKSKTNLNINSSADLATLIDQIYAGVSIEMPMVQTTELTAKDMIQSFTYLENVENVEYIAVSEPLMSSQAYSLVLAKVKDEADANAIAKEMNEKIDMRKWICVSAERVYTVASGNVVCLVMSNEETAKTVYESFKTIAGQVGEENVRVEVQEELPDDMLPGQDGLAY